MRCIRSMLHLRSCVNRIMDRALVTFPFASPTQHSLLRTTVPSTTPVPQRKSIFALLSFGMLNKIYSTEFDQSFGDRVAMSIFIGRDTTVIYRKFGEDNSNILDQPTHHWMTDRGL